MAVRVWLASEQDRPALAKAYAAYMAEIAPDDDRAESARYFDLYWQEPDLRFPYIFGHDRPEGFAFVCTPDTPDLEFEMAEFCVSQAFRARGLGTEALALIFARHPGRWEASVLQTNAMGLGFWPTALARSNVSDLRYRDGDVARDYRFTVS